MPSRSSASPRLRPAEAPRQWHLFPPHPRFCSCVALVGELLPSTQQIAMAFARGSRANLWEALHIALTPSRQASAITVSPPLNMIQSDRKDWLANIVPSLILCASPTAVRKNPVRPIARGKFPQLPPEFA